MSWPEYPSGFDVNTALTCANFVQEAYFQLFINAGTPPPPFGFDSYPLQMPPNPSNSTTSPYTLQYTIQTNIEGAPYDYFGYVITGPSFNNDNKTMAAFVLRGTESSAEWIDDILDANQSSFTGSGKSSLGMVHSGFNDIYSGFTYTNVNTGSSGESLSTVLSYLHDTKGINATDLVVTGHSLGGALATLMAIDIVVNQTQFTSYTTPLTCYTFGSPRVGDPGTFVSNFNDNVESGNIVHYRVANGLDIVPALPPNIYYDFILGSGQEYDYEAVDSFCPVDSGLVDFDFHSLNAYAAGLNNLINPPASLAVPRRAARRRPARVERPSIGAVPPSPLPAPPPVA